MVNVSVCFERARLQSCQKNVKVNLAFSHRGMLPSVLSNDSISDVHRAYGRSVENLGKESKQEDPHQD